MFIKADFILQDIYEINENHLFGVKLVIFDLDSTVMESKSGIFTQKTIEFLQNLTKNYNVAIVSNNKNEKYINSINKIEGIPIYYNAKKPDTMHTLKVIKQFETQPHEVAIVGDRPLTDILLAKRMGAVGILVDSIARHKEGPATRLVRWLERRFII